MSTYRISQDVTHEHVAADGTIVSVTLKAGDLTPSSDVEAVAISHLVSAGLAEVADKPTKKKADVPADVTSEEI